MGITGKTFFVKGGEEGQLGEIIYEGVLYKPSDPDYEMIKEKVKIEFANRMTGFFKPVWK